MLRRTLLRAEDRVPGLLGFWLFLSEGQRWGFGRWPHSMQQGRGDLRLGRCGTSKQRGPRWLLPPAGAEGSGSSCEFGLITI